MTVVKPQAWYCFSHGNFSPTPVSRFPCVLATLSYHLGLSRQNIVAAGGACFTKREHVFTQRSISSFAQNVTHSIRSSSASDEFMHCAGNSYFWQLLPPCASDWKADALLSCLRVLTTNAYIHSVGGRISGRPANCQAVFKVNKYTQQVCSIRIFSQTHYKKRKIHLFVRYAKKFINHDSTSHIF